MFLAKISKLFSHIFSIKPHTSWLTLRLMKFTVQLLSCEEDEEGSNSDRPKGISIVHCVSRGSFLALYIQNSSRASAPIKRLTNASRGRDFRCTSLKCGRLQTFASTEILLGWTEINSTLCMLNNEKEVSLERPDSTRLHDINLKLSAIPIIILGCFIILLPFL